MTEGGGLCTLLHQRAPGSWSKVVCAPPSGDACHHLGPSPPFLPAHCHKGSCGYKAVSTQYWQVFHRRTLSQGTWEWLPCLWPNVYHTHAGCFHLGLGSVQQGTVKPEHQGVAALRLTECLSYWTGCFILWLVSVLQGMIKPGYSGMAASPLIECLSHPGFHETWGLLLSH